MSITFTKDQKLAVTPSPSSSPLHGRPFISQISAQKKGKYHTFVQIGTLQTPKINTSPLSLSSAKMRRYFPSRILNYPKDGGGRLFLKIQRYCLYNRILYIEDFTVRTNDQEMLNMCHICLYRAERNI